MKQRVSFDFVGSIGLAVASHIRGDRAVSGVRESLQLMAPGIPGFWKAVAKQNHRSRTLFGHAHADAVGLDETKCRLGHFSRHCVFLSTIEKLNGKSYRDPRSSNASWQPLLRIENLNILYRGGR